MDYRGGPVLGIETSCDETSAAVVDTDGIRSLTIASQDGHAAFGGVVPEIAAREHLRTIGPIVRHALSTAGCGEDELEGVGVTVGPGLVGALLVGVNWAKAYAYARALPLIGIHHMEGHLFGTWLEDARAQPPFVGLLVSGGHTMLIECRAWGSYRLLGQTRDDAAGEAFDKVARLLGLGYPGGPRIDKAAKRGRPGRFRLPRPLLTRPRDRDGFDMSFSGLKTAVARLVGEIDDLGEAVPDVAAEFQEAVVDVLVDRTLRAVEVTGCRRVVLGGGVACNSRLRQRLTEDLNGSAGPAGELYAPSPRLATDNAAMIAAVARYRLSKGERSPWSLNANPSLPFPGLVACG